MRGLKKTAPDGADRHLHGRGDSMTNSAQWGRVGEKTVFVWISLDKQDLYYPFLLQDFPIPPASSLCSLSFGTRSNYHVKETPFFSLTL